MKEDDVESENNVVSGRKIYNGPKVNASEISDSSFLTSSTPIMNKELIAQVERKDRSHWQFDRLIPIWIILFCLIMQSMIKDSDIFGVKNWSAVYWIVYVIYIIICISIVVYTIP